MNAESLIPIGTSVGGGFLIGALLGYFLKKIVKILMFVAGGIVGLLLYLQQQQIISVNIEKLETSSTAILTSFASTFDKMTQVGDFTSIGIPLTASIAAGFTVALAKSENGGNKVMANLKQILSSVWNKSFHNGTKFEEIIGRNDIKRIFNMAILSDKPVSILLLGSPASAKTMFLTEIMRRFKSCLFVVGSNTTKAGLVNQLFEKRPKFVLIDELEKMNNTDQTSLLHLMETGIISETKFSKTRQMELTSWVFATANSCEKIIEPLLSRFFIVEIPEYTFEEFKDIAVLGLQKKSSTITPLLLLLIKSGMSRFKRY